MTSNGNSSWLILHICDRTISVINNFSFYTISMPRLSRRRRHLPDSGWNGCRPARTVYQEQTPTAPSSPSVHHRQRAFCTRVSRRNPSFQLTYLKSLKCFGGNFLLAPMYDWPNNTRCFVVLSRDTHVLKFRAHSSQWHLEMHKANTIASNEMLILSGRQRRTKFIAKFIWSSFIHRNYIRSRDNDRIDKECAKWACRHIITIVRYIYECPHPYIHAWMAAEGNATWMSVAYKALKYWIIIILNIIHCLHCLCTIRQTYRWMDGCMVWHWEWVDAVLCSPKISQPNCAEKPYLSDLILCSQNTHTRTNRDGEGEFRCIALNGTQCESHVLVVAVTQFTHLPFLNNFINHSIWIYAQYTQGRKTISWLGRNIFDLDKIVAMCIRLSALIK